MKDHRREERERDAPEKFQNLLADLVPQPGQAALVGKG